MKRKHPLLYPIRVISHLTRLPTYVEIFYQQDKDRQDADTRILTALEDIRKELETLQQSTTAISSIDARLVNLQDRFSKLNKSRISSSESTPLVNNTVSDNHEFDYFYKLFEDRFRGSEEEIKNRVSEHLPLFVALPQKLKKLPIVDIGCGRGEFLQLLKDSKLHGIGVDMNKSMVDRATKLGLNAVQNDAFTYLSDKKNGSLAAITGFHIVEHIPFEVLMKIFEESYRTIASGGFALFETPNPAALTVGANTFYLDPSHQRPVPSQLLAFMLESVGFKSEIIPLHRLKPELKTGNKEIDDMYESLYGPGDYAVIAKKIL